MSGAEGQTAKPDQGVRNLLGVFVSIWLAAYLLHRSVALFPADPKTLATDAVVIGFFGAVLLVEELVRRLVAEFERVVITVFVLGALVMIATILKDVLKNSFLDGLVGGLVLPIAVGVLIALGAALGTPFSGRIGKSSVGRRVGPPLGRYGPIAIGVALLGLSVFLQLRSISLGKS